MEASGESPAARLTPGEEDLPVRPAPPARWRVWLRRLFLVAGMSVLALIAAAFALVWPFVRDDLALDRVVLAVALDWRDFGRDKAQARLEYELDHEGIGLQVSDDSCALDEPGPGALRVRCAWTGQVGLPGVPWRLPLSFASEAEVGPDGSLR